MKIQKYAHENQTSYTLGATLTFELIKCDPQHTVKVYINPQQKKPIL